MALFFESLNVVLGALSAVHFEVVVKLQSGFGDPTRGCDWRCIERLIHGGLM